MLEKIFGKKSTGVVYIFCASFLVFMLAGAIAAYFLVGGTSLLSLVGYAVFTAIELVCMSLPVFVQKRYRLYIPPIIEISICLYAVLFLAGEHYYKANTTTQNTLIPFLGGFVIAMTVFCILHSLLSLRAEKKGKRFSPLQLSALTFFVTELLVLLFYLILYDVGLVLRLVNAEDINGFLAYSAAHQGGNLLFCIIGYLTVRSHRGGRYKIQSFKHADEAELEALERKNKTQYTVVKNISGDSTDYRKLLRQAKAKYFLGRILYLAIYAVYLVFTSLSFAKQGRTGITISILLGVGFVLTTIVYIYEYYLFRKGAPNQRLRRLKIAKSAVRFYSLSLIISATFAADSFYNSISALYSLIMALINLCMLFYNLFGKPRRYPAAPKANDETDKTQNASQTDKPLQGDLQDGEQHGGAPPDGEPQGDETSEPIVRFHP